MARRPKPWWRAQCNQYYVTINGVQHPLGPEKKEAERRFHELMSKAPEEPIAPGTVAEVVEHFMDWTQLHRAPRTYDWYKERIDRFYPRIKHLRVADLKPFHIQEQLDKHDWSPAYKAGCVTALKRAFNWARKQGYIDRNPLHGLEKPDPGKREQIMSEKEFDDALSNVPNQNFNDLAHFVWYTGCRPEEAIIVEARHFDGTHSRIVIPADQAKGRRRIRIIYLPDEALEIVRRNAEANPDGPIFRNTKGRPWTAYAVNNTFERIKRKTGTKFCMYTLRHSYATHKLQTGTDPITLANLLGHADTSMLSKVYANLAQDPEYLRKQAARRSGDS